MKMKIAFLATALIFLAFGGCDEYKSVASGSSTDNGGGETDGALYVPGGEGRTTDDLVFDEDFKVFSMDSGIDPQEVTTQETLGRWEDGKYHIQGLSYVSTSSLSASGFVDGYFVYWNKPLTGDYKITARVRMTAVQGFSTSKGIQFGVFAPMNAPSANGEQIFSGATRAAGMMFRSSTGSSNPLGEIRYYYATDSSNAAFTAGTSSHPGNHIIHNTSYKTEYFFEMSRTRERYTMVVRNSKTGDLVPQGAGQSYNNPQTVNENASGTSALHPSIKYGAPVYAGFALMGCSAELSQIKIWDNAEGDGDPIFSTPDTKPAYVPVEQVKVNFNPAATTILTDNIWADSDFPNIANTEQWFKFTATASTQYIHVDLSTQPVPTSLSVQLFDSSNAAVGTESTLSSTTTPSSNTTPNTSLPLTAGQEYYIRVKSSRTSGTYKIAFNSSKTLPGSASVLWNKFLFNEAAITTSGIVLTPSFTPTWADNNRVEWLMESCEPSGAITIAGTGTPFTLPGINGSTYEVGKITVDGGLIPVGGQATAKLIAIARDLNLDNFTGFPPVDYPLKQTLAEYRFEITVTK